MSERLIHGERVWYVCIPVDEADLFTHNPTTLPVVAENECKRIKEEVIRHVDVPVRFGGRLEREIEIREPEAKP
jgi:hypothetical protein